MAAVPQPGGAAARRLPDFISIGAFKSGTTSLMSWLSQHPQIFIPWLQEPNYFASPHFKPHDDGETRPQRSVEGVYNRLRTDSLSQYAALFDRVPPDAVAGESSPQYLRDPVACPRIAELLPDVKLIAILRHPADRAFSDYSMLVRDGLETGSFDEAIRRPRGMETFAHYVETGFYGSQLRPYVETFPADQLRVVFFEDLRDNPRGLVRSFFEWFGVDPDFEPDVTEVRNISGVPRNAMIASAYRVRRRLQPYVKPFVPSHLQRLVDARLIGGLDRAHLDLALRRELISIYTDDIRLLAELVDRDLEHWLR